MFFVLLIVAVAIWFFGHLFLRTDRYEEYEELTPRPPDYWDRLDAGRENTLLLEGQPCYSKRPNRLRAAALRTFKEKGNGKSASVFQLNKRQGSGGSSQVSV